MLTGHASFVDDVSLPSLWYAAFVRSDVASGRITSLDTGTARLMPGVRAVITGADLAGYGNSAASVMEGGVLPFATLLATSDVRFVGDPVAIVVASTRASAQDAAQAVVVEYDLQRPVLGFEIAAEADALVHPELGTNVAATTASAEDRDLEAALAGAAHVVDETFDQHRYVQAPMEPRGVVARFQTLTGELEVWISTQNPHEVRQVACRVTGVPENLVRVIGGDVGGGFGQKSFVSRDEAAVIAVAHRLGHAVKWIETRSENLIAGCHARADRATVRMAVDGDGRFVAATIDHLEDCGAYPLGGGNGGAGARVVRMFPGPYRIPRVGYRSRSVWTNTSGRGPYRGPWMMETTAREQMVDVVARAVGIDPLDLRRRNTIRTDEQPHTMATGTVIDGVTPSETLELAAKLIDYAGFRDEQAKALEAGRLLGIGISLFVEPTSTSYGAFGVEAATVRVLPSGAVEASFGTGAHGQGIETTMAQVIADHLGVDLDTVSVRQGDTASAPFGGGTAGSRTAVIGGGAARLAALVVRDKVLQVAAHLMEAAAEDLEMQDGIVRVKGSPSSSMTIAEIAWQAYHHQERLPDELSLGLEATSRYKAPPVTWANACHICTVEVDEHTGKVDILRYVVSEDCGVMINPMIVEGQIAGGVAQGIGGALLEHLQYDEHGTPMTTTFADYLLPTTSEIPPIEFGHIETPSNTPGGSKGVGEGGAIGAPAAVFNAVADALALRGAKVTRQPLHPNALVEALQAAARTAGSTGPR